MMRRPVLTTMAAILCIGALAGCNNDADGEPSADEPTATASDVPTATTPSEGTSSTEPTEASESAPPTDPPDDDPSDSAPGRARRAQIPASQLPGFNAEWKWTKESSGPGPGQDMPSVCMKSSLTAIGGVSEYHTDFGSPMDAKSWAVQQTVVFPDDETAKTSQSVLEAWQAKCANQAESLGLKKVQVAPISDVDTTVGPGEQWLVTYRPVAGDPYAAWLQAEGFVRDGDTLTYLVMTTAGQDYNYEAGEEPMAQALQVAAKRLLKSR